MSCPGSPAAFSPNAYSPTSPHFSPTSATAPTYGSPSSQIGSSYQPTSPTWTKPEILENRRLSSIPHSQNQAKRPIFTTIPSSSSKPDRRSSPSNGPVTNPLQPENYRYNARPPSTKTADDDLLLEMYDFDAFLHQTDDPNLNPTTRKEWSDTDVDLSSLDTCKYPKESLDHKVQPQHDSQSSSVHEVPPSSIPPVVVPIEKCPEEPTTTPPTLPSRQPSPSPAAKGDLVDYIIALQSFDGPFHLIPHDITTLSNLVQKAIGKGVDLRCEEVWDTEVLVQLLVTMCAEWEETWSLVVRKAKGWLRERSDVKGAWED